MRLSTENWQRVPRELAGRAEDRVRRVDEQFRALCRERPLTVLLGSVAFGFLIARLVSRR